MLRVSKYRDFARVMRRAHGGLLLAIVRSLLIRDSRNLFSEKIIVWRLRHSLDSRGSGERLTVEAHSRVGLVVWFS